MALRFQRRIRVAPGIRLNLSKSGVGISVGPRGASASIGRRGTYTNLGLPGTGLSLRQRVNTSGESSTGSRKARVQPSQKSLQQMLIEGRLQFSINVRDSGDIDLQYVDGTALSQEEAALVRKHFGEHLRSEIGTLCERMNRDLEGLGRVHEGTPVPTTTPVFQSRPFAIPKPERLLDPKPSFWQQVWPPARRALESENQQRSDDYRRAFAEWTTQRQRHERREALREEIETRHVLESVDAMQGILSDHLGRILWPKAADIDFDLGENHHTIAIDIDLPTSDEMPTTEYSLPAKQIRVSSKKLSDTRRRQLYMRYAHGIAFRVLGEVFARLPTVQRALISAYTQGVNPGTGVEEDHYLYSVIAGRDDWNRIDFSALERVDPVVALECFQLRRSMTKTGVFKPIEPFGLEDLERSRKGPEK